jgi:Ca2+-binding RTX toxin-like protein
MAIRKSSTSNLAQERDDLLRVAPEPYANIPGTPGDDNLVDTAENDDINAGDGNDTITVSSGQDNVDGGTGRDTLIVNYSVSTNSVITANGPNGSVENGYSVFYTDSQGRHVIANGVENIQITSGSGNDRLTTAGGDDIVTTGAGDDIVDVGRGDDRADGGNNGDGTRGIDGISADLATLPDGSIDSTAVNWNLEANTYSGPGGLNAFTNFEYFGNSVTGGGGVATGSGNDTIVTRNIDADDILSTGDGDDTATFSRGEDTFIAGAGTDRLIFDYSAATNTVLAGNGPNGSLATGYSGFYTDSSGTRQIVYSGVEHFTITTGSGNDNINTADGQDVITTGAGNDTVNALGDNDLVDGGIGDDVLNGGDGVDTLSYASLAGGVGVTVNLAETAAQATGGAGTDTISNFEFLTGSQYADQLTGSIDNNLINGGAGDDTMIGGQGNDTYVVDSIGDIVIESSGEGNSDDVRTALAVYTLTAANVEILSGFRTDIGQQLTGSSGNNIVRGTEQGDILDGGDGEDTLLGFGGDDTLRITGGSSSFDTDNELVSGGDGNDLLVIDYSAMGDQVGLYVQSDEASGAAGFVDVPDGTRKISFNGIERLSVTTGSGNDILTGVSGADVFNGGGGNDLLLGRGGNDTLNGDANDDTLDGGSGDDALNGGAGSDTASYTSSTAAVQVSLAILTAQNTGSATGLDTLSGIENLTGSNFGDTLTGDGNSNVIRGEGGNDTLDGNGGQDTLIGGSGDDTYIIDSADDVVTEAAGQAGGTTDTVQTGIAVYTLAANVERLFATNDATHDFRGNASDNVIFGGNGRDIFRLQDGGNENVQGFGGVDTFYFGAAFNASDTVIGGNDFDVLALQGNYAAGVTFGNASTGVANIANIESISLYSGANAVFGDTANNRYSYNLTTVDATVAANAVLRVNGANLLAGENLTFNGGAETDGSFLIYGGLGVDTLTGGAKGDNFVFAHDGRFGAGDVVTGGAGYDVVYLRGDYTIDFNTAGFAGSLNGVESIGLLSATSTLYAGGGDGEFDYTITWNDAMLATGATMVVNGSRLTANESMAFDGSQETGGNFRLFGGAGGDVLRGGAGNDLIFGNLGADTLAGGAGGDIFRYVSALDSTVEGRDAIQDFSSDDLIDLTGVDAIAGTAANDAFSFIGSNAFTGQAGQLRAVQTSGPIWTVSGDTNGDGNADFEFLVVVTNQNQPLTDADFAL